MKVKSEREVAQSCPTLSDPMDCSLPAHAKMLNNFLCALEKCNQKHNEIPHHFTLAAAAAAKLLQSCPTLCDPTDGSPSGSPVPGILQARILEWVATAFSNA